MPMKKILGCFLLIFFLSSCIVIHNGNVSAGPLLSAKDQYVNLVVGEAETALVFGLGKFDQDQLVLEAKKNLFSKLQLHKNEYYANFTCDINKKYVLGFFLQIIKATVSADVMRANDSSNNVIHMDYLRKLNISVNATQNTESIKQAATSKYFNGNQLVNGDTIFFSKDALNYNAYVVDQRDNEWVVLKAVGNDYQNILVPLLTNSFFFNHSDLPIVKIGMTFNIDVPDEYNTFPVKKTFKVIGVCNDLVLLKLNKLFVVREAISLSK